MIGTRRAAVVTAAALALVGAQSVQAACIDPPVAQAARLHEFETLMMTVSLRCSLRGVAMQPHYEAMVSSHQAHFDAAVQRLQGFFATSSAPETRHGGLYDRYATMIANRYGGGETSLDSCRLFDAVAAELSAARDEGRTLAAVAEAMVRHPVLERATCPAAP
jgi:hypothetical protein